MAGAHFSRQFNRTGNIDGRRPAHEQPFIDHQVIDQRQGIGVSKAKGRVNRGFGKVCGDPSLTNALGNGIAVCLQFSMHVMMPEC